MCYSKINREQLERDREYEPKREEPELERGKVDEVKRFEHMPSSLPHEPSPVAEPALHPA